MNKKFFNTVLIILSLHLFLGIGCKRKDILLQDTGNGAAPQVVSNIQVKNLPGGAKLTYTIPKDPNISAVKAVYELKPGERSEVKSSIYVDTLQIEGFGDSAIHTINIYSVGKNGKLSTPTEVEIHPTTPPVFSVFKTMDLAATFSGAVVSFKNPTEASMAYVLLCDSTGNGDWVTADTYYSKSNEGHFSTRGFDSVKTKFAVYARDRWGNRSDTITKILKPLYEEVLDKGKFEQLVLPGDDWEGHTWSGLPLREMSFIWNGEWNNSNDCFHTKTSIQQMPQWFTFDLGDTYTLSRFKFYHRAGGDGRYVGGDPETFEIWGSNHPSEDGSFDSWQLLGSFTSKKPTSGATVSAEDIQFACVDGEDFDFPPGTPPMRYLRWKTTKTWGGFNYIYISELTFWGTNK